MTAHLKALEKTKIQMMSIKDSAFFTALCFSLNHIWDEEIPTACTNGYEIRYNPEFFEKLSRGERLFLLLHETLHVALQHMTRRGNRDPKLWNYAADYVINYMLVSRGFQMPEGGLYDERYADMTTEEVYNELLHEDQEDLPPLTMLDIDEPETEDEKAGTQERIDDMLIKAAIQSEMAEDQAGTIPGNLDWYIDSLRNPRLPWDNILSRLITKVVKRGYNWKRPNRRFFPNHLLPSRHSKRICNLVVAIDISGSISREQFHAFCSEVYSILVNQRPSSLKLIQFDTQIQHIDDISSVRDLMNVKFTGGGGTDIQPVIDWSKENRPTAMIVFTDGHFDTYHANPRTALFWIVHNNPYWNPPFGKVIPHLL